MSFSPVPQRLCAGQHHAEHGRHPDPQLHRRRGRLLPPGPGGGLADGRVPRPGPLGPKRCGEQRLWHGNGGGGRVKARGRWGIQAGGARRGDVRRGPVLLPGAGLGPPQWGRMVPGGGEDLQPGPGSGDPFR